MNSPLNYLGGKRILRYSLISLFPNHVCYVEPFAGGAWVLFGKQPSKVEVLNDINHFLITFYSVIQKNYENFVKMFLWEFISRKKFDEYLHDLRDPDIRKILTDVEIAHRYYYVLKYSFGGQGKNFGYSRTRKPKSLSATNLLYFITAVHERLQNVIIECLDYQEIINRYDSENTLFYLDPPYRVKSAQSYFKFFKDDDFIALRDRLEKISGRFVLSLNDDPFILNLFEKFTIKRIDVKYSVCKVKPVSSQELIILNF